MIDLFERKIKDLGGIDGINHTSISSQLDILLPDYIKHILDNYSGSYFNEDIVVSNLDNIPVASSGCIGLGQFLDYTIDGDSIKNLDDRFFISYFPFVEGSAGDYFLIGVDDGNFGKIYYWHHESTHGEEIYFVCNSFDEFINNLETDDFQGLKDDDIVSFNLDF